VYTMTNSATGNAIEAYSRASDGAGAWTEERGARRFVPSDERRHRVQAPGSGF
jgi:hypothetical protein